MHKKYTRWDSIVGLDSSPESLALLRFLNVYPPALPGACVLALLSCMFFLGANRPGQDRPNPHHPLRQ